jgi:hypothetical protein
MTNYVYSLICSYCCKVSCEAVNVQRKIKKYVTAIMEISRAQSVEPAEITGYKNFISMSSNASVRHINISYRHKLLGVIALLLGCACSTLVTAQELRRGETVTERARPNLDARGVQIGVFQLFPAVGIDFLYDDNIFADNNIEFDDQITVITPELIFAADWSRAQLELGTDFAIGRYADFDTEDYEDWRVWGDLDVDLGRGQLAAEVRHNDFHEQRTSADDSRGIRPTQYTSDFLQLGYRNRIGHLGIRAELSRRALNFDDTTTLDGPESNRDRDRERDELRIRMGYSRAQKFQPFVETGFTEINFDQKFDNDGFQRSSNGYDIVGGTEIDISGTTFGEIFIGYIQRDFDDERYLRVDGPIFGGEFTWNISGLTTLQLSASRLINTTTIVGAAGITNTGFGLELDHELLRDLILSFDLSVNNEDFEGIDRSDDIFGMGLEGVYLMNRYLQFRFGINYLNRDTSPVDSGGREFDKKRIFFGIQGQI